jgi:hypothetical protein
MSLGGRDVERAIVGVLFCIKGRILTIPFRCRKYSDELGICSTALHMASDVYLDRGLGDHSGAGWSLPKMYKIGSPNF